jgi:BirA family biotin operon repressor/biotin-[acetyl-CoA-carboxylase] ligase
MLIPQSRAYYLMGRLATLIWLSTSKISVASAALASGRNKTKLHSMASQLMVEPSPHLMFHHLKEPVGSTQDEARRLLRERHGDEAGKCLAVLADQQNQGRGTQGRKWESVPDRAGNLYLTVCVPMDQIPVTLTLLPLQVGVLVARGVSRLLEACRVSNDPSNKKVLATVKWPNDVLIDDKKVSGTLIESEVLDGTSWLLVGIGVNVAFAPSLTESPGKQVRGATCLQEYCPDNLLPQDTAEILGIDLAKALVEWVVDREMDKATKELKVIKDWKSFASFGGIYELRGDITAEDAGTYKGETVITVDIQNDGQLVVRGDNGVERLLIADYMF